MTFFGPGVGSSWPRWRTGCAFGAATATGSCRSMRLSAPPGWHGERRLGRQTIRLDTILGTAERRRDFDRRFRPTSHQARFRWERLALAQRRGEAIPPIEVYRVCDWHFVIDGHHRVSIAAATGERQIEAYVTQVLAAVPCGPGRAPAHHGRRAEAACGAA